MKSQTDRSMAALAAALPESSALDDSRLTVDYCLKP